MKQDINNTTKLRNSKRTRVTESMYTTRRQGNLASRKQTTMLDDMYQKLNNVVHVKPELDSSSPVFTRLQYVQTMLA